MATTSFTIGSTSDLDSGIEDIDLTGPDSATNTTCTFNVTNGVTLTPQLSRCNLTIANAVAAGAGGFGGNCAEVVDGGAAMVLHPTFAALIGLAHEAGCAFVVAGPVVAGIRAGIAENDRRRTKGGRARLSPR